MSEHMTTYSRRDGELIGTEYAFALDEETLTAEADGEDDGRVEIIARRVRIHAVAFNSGRSHEQRGTPRQGESRCEQDAEARSGERAYRGVIFAGGMARHHLPKTLTADEITLLMGRPNVACPTGLRNRAVLELLHRAGLRASEACGLHVRDLDWKTGELRIRSEVAKGGREAVVFVDDRTLEWLKRWKVERRRYAAGRPWLFTTLRGGPLDRRYVWEMVSRYARRAGVDRPVWPHMLRHTFATDLLGDGFNVAEVQALMRHADLRTTAVYLHVRNEDLRAKVRARK